MTIIQRSPILILITIALIALFLYSTILFTNTYNRYYFIKKTILIFATERLRGWIWFEKSIIIRALRGTLLFIITLALFPAALVPFQLPVWRISLSIRIWLIIFIISINHRRLQWKSELLADSSLSFLWTIFAVIVETIRRIARALTLGARIGVNVIVGGILHAIVGELSSIIGIIILSLFETIVVLVQVYVFILLASSYRLEIA